MEFMGFLGSALVIAGIGALVILVLAVVQEGKLGGKGASVKNGFFAAVSLVLLAIAVAALTFTVRLGLSTWVFPKASYGYNSIETLRGTPPYPPILTRTQTDASTSAPVPVTTTVRTCVSGCEFSADEVQAVHAWATEYRTWLIQEPVDTLAQAKRRDLVNALSFLLVAAPLFVVFFRTVRRHPVNQPNVVRSVYFYYVAFAGLVLAVVSAALLLNVGLKALAGVSDADPSTKSVPVPYVVVDDPSVLFVRGISNCGAVCGFTAEEVGYANRFATDLQASQHYQPPDTSNAQGDLATNIPLLLVGVPLFWFHFATVRHEQRETEPVRTPERPRRRKKA